MDGTSIELDRRTAEALRQEKVYHRAMLALARDERQSEALEDAVLAPAYALGSTADPSSKMGRVAGWSRVLFVAILGLIINYKFYTFAIAG